MFTHLRRLCGRARFPLWMCAAVLPMSLALAGDYKPPVVEVIAFDYEKLALMEVEREKMATNLAAFVINSLEKNPPVRQIENARKLIGLALQLHPKNRTALVANFQLNRDISPKKVEADYKPEVFSTLLMERAKTLRLKGDPENTKLAGYLFFAAVEMDPENEAAVYEYELYRIEVGELNWKPITDAVSGKTAVSGK